VKLTAVRVLSGGKPAPHIIDVERPLELELELLFDSANIPYRAAVNFYTQGVCAFASVEPRERPSAKSGKHVCRLKVPANLLAEGEYSCTVAVTCSKGVKHHYLRTQDVVSFLIADQVNVR
jgi:hypothetical protein